MRLQQSELGWQGEYHCKGDVEEEDAEQAL